MTPDEAFERCIYLVGTADLVLGTTAQGLRPNVCGGAAAMPISGRERRATRAQPNTEDTTRCLNAADKQAVWVKAEVETAGETALFNWRLRVLP